MLANPFVIPANICDPVPAEWEATALDAIESLGGTDSQMEKRALAAASAARFLPMPDAPVGSAISLRVLEQSDVRDPWCTPKLAHQAHETIVRLGPDIALVEHILKNSVKTQFAQRVAIGRVDTRGRPHIDGGEHPAWNAQYQTLDPGAWNVLAWCIHSLKTMKLPFSTWEHVWPLVVPPVMVLLDDAQLHLKLRGTQAALCLVESAPVALLERTGIAALLDDALARTFLHLAEAPDGPRVLRIAGSALQLLAAHRPETGAFDARCKIYADGVLGALSYCGPAAAAAPALIPQEVRCDGGARMPTITSPRLQQVLAGSAVALALQLRHDLKLGIVRYWNATMEWCISWLDSALSACNPPFPHARTADLGELVDQATGVADAPASDGGWLDAGDVLVESICAAAILSNDLFSTVLCDARPSRFPGLAQGGKLLAALAKLWIRIEGLSLGPRYARMRGPILTLYETLIRDDSLRQVALRLTSMDARLSGLARDK